MLTHRFCGSIDDESEHDANRIDADDLVGFRFRVQGQAIVVRDRGRTDPNGACQTYQCLAANRDLIFFYCVPHAVSPDSLTRGSTLMSERKRAELNL